MRPNSLRTRGVAFAYLFGPPRHVRREEASTLHSAVCDRLKMDDIGFRYRPSEQQARPTSRGFSIELDRKEGRGGFTMVVDNHDTQQPIRCLMEWAWPPTPQHVTEYFDQTGEALFDALQGDWQRVMAEVRWKAQCDVRASDATQYISEHLLKLTPETLAKLGDRLSFTSLEFHSASAKPTSDPMERPHRQVRIEVLREDPRCVYIELMSQWTQVPLAAKGIDLSTIRPIEGKPSAYVDVTQKFLEEWVAGLGHEQGEGES